MADITHPDYSGERLIACYDPPSGRLKDAGKSGVRVGKTLGQNTMAKHFILTITDTTLIWERNQETTVREAYPSGIYLIRTSVDAATTGAFELLATPQNQHQATVLIHRHTTKHGKWPDTTRKDRKIPGNPGIFLSCTPSMGICLEVKVLWRRRWFNF